MELVPKRELKIFGNQWQISTAAQKQNKKQHPTKV
jgi:hypothetical protein